VIPINVTQPEIEIVLKLMKGKKYLGEIISFSEGLRIKREYETEDKDNLPIVKQYQFGRWSNIEEGSYISPENFAKTLSVDSGRYNKIMSEKILVAEDALKISATLDKDQYIPQGGIYFGVAKNNPFILGLLNSRLLSHVYKLLFGGMHMGGGYLRYRKGFLECLPITNFKTSDMENITSVVNTIISNSNNYSDDELNEMETRLDDIVMNVYKLTDEEKEIIRNS